MSRPKHSTAEALPVPAGLDSDIARKFREARQAGVAAHDFVKDFLGDFLSPDTKRAYEADLAAFFGFLAAGGESPGHPRDIQAYHFQLYRDHLIEQGKASATVNRRLVAVRSFMKWAVAAKLVDHNPLDVVKLPKIQTESPTQAFDDEEVSRMLAAPDVDTPTGNLHRLCMVLLFHLGLRRSELTSLRLMDFQQQRGHFTVRVHGKGDKVRLIPVNDHVRAELHGYYARLARLGVKLAPDEWLLQTNPLKRRGQRLDGSTVYRLIEKYARELGINKKVSPHSCRATVISHLLDTQLTPIRDVAIFAGHANVTTTERYDKRRQNLEQSAAYQVDFAAKKKAAS